jgi:puromycin-sensitive aminopeptidase
MLEQYLGTERFRDGVRRYLAAHRYGNTETTDLWDAIEESAEGKPIRELMDSWIRQGGHPLVTARAQGNEVVLSQEPFSYLPEAERPADTEPSAIGSSWLVPVALERRPGEGQEAGTGCHYELLRDQPIHVPAGNGTLVVNVGGSGVYRLRYDDSLLEDILAGFDSLVPLERFKLVADTWACALAGLTPIEQFFTLVRRLEAEKDPSVWAMVAGALGLLDFAVAEQDRGALESFVQTLLGPELERVGWDPRHDDDSESPRRRAIFIASLGTVGADPKVRAESRERFLALDKGVPLDVDIASAVLHVVSATAGADEYGALLGRFRSPADPMEEKRYLDSLSRVGNPDLAVETCELCLSEIRTQDAPYLLRKLLMNRLVGPEVWEFVAGHWDKLLEMYPENSIPRMVEVSRLCHIDNDGTPRLSREVMDFLATHRLGGQQRPVDQSIERLGVNVRFVLAQRPHLRSLLVKA